MNDTIAAISTSLGVGAIAIIRVSGNDSVEIVNKICKNQNLLEKKSHTINYNHIIENNRIIDEVLISIMLAPNTYTGENVVEINTHGGIATINKVLEILLSNGCRLAEPGEFTKRAFLNGKKDLIEAEAVMDLINSKNEKARKLAINQLNGDTSNLIRKFRKQLVDIIANIEVNIDYPEYEDIKVLTINDIKKSIKEIEENLIKILKSSEDTKLIKEGINTLIIGKPNVGKSSILNKLLEEDKAIVTDIAGTTRDIVEGNIILDGIQLNIIDTAGIRETEDIVESIGVKKSLDLVNKSELVLLVLNNNEELSTEDKKLLELIKNKNYLILLNKIDLENHLNLDGIDIDKIIRMSAKENIGFIDLKDKIKEMFNLEQIDKDDLNYLSSARSISILKSCVENLKSIKQGLDNNQSIDMIEIDIKEIWNKLGEIIGESYSDELLDQLFSKFCLGK